MLFKIFSETVVPDFSKIFNETYSAFKIVVVTILNFIPITLRHCPPHHRRTLNSPMPPLARHLIFSIIVAAFVVAASTSPSPPITTLPVTTLAYIFIYICHKTRMSYVLMKIDGYEPQQREPFNSDKDDKRRVTIIKGVNKMRVKGQKTEVEFN
ncbi:hypothetical protein L484_015593 [Morus notabilis]|uniref:Uncharacterized protein n=1 Tax=Morus notabilis TaxID=981085 RepID=W9SRY2_9ROSA|nr:hypothetical protein L484_015593 [Morus notabilis]